jgi:hypothetical protein
LLVVRCFDEDVLNIASHLGVSHDLITLIYHEELDLIKVNQLMFGQVIESARGGDDDMWIFRGILNLIFIILQGHSSKVASVS